MKRLITIPSAIHEKLRNHLFQNELEQGAFLFANVEQNTNEVNLLVQDVYLVPPNGWQVQLEVYLEMKDSERAKIMALARTGGYAVIDCHSHPGSDDEVQFSISDRYGITDFAAYANWKLNGKPFAAMVWGEESIDGVYWMDNFKNAFPVDEVVIKGDKVVTLNAQGSWFWKDTHPWWKDRSHGT